jgi:hypothetical protein
MGIRLISSRSHPLYSLQIFRAKLFSFLLVDYIVILLIEISLKHLEVGQLLVTSHSLLVTLSLDAASDSLERELLLVATLAQLRLGNAADLLGRPASLLIRLDLYLEACLLLQILVRVINFSFAFHLRVLFLNFEAVK